MFAMHDAITAARKTIEVLGVTQPVMETWEHMSEADRRRWALDICGIQYRCGDAAIDDAITAAERLVNYVNGPQSASVQSPSVGLSVGLHSSEMPDLQPRVTSEFLEQSA